MSLDPYASCSCGSGKKFKWCCQAIYAGIQHAWQLETSNQHDIAAKAMDQVVQQNQGNPEAWGQRALLYLAQNDLGKAEETLDKAFALTPNYPFGLKMRAEMRYHEGEYLRALTLARKAAEAYDVDAHNALSSIYAIIHDCELHSHRPVAARAALARSSHLDPANERLRETLDQSFGEKSRFPLSARKAYEFKKLTDRVAGTRRQAWNRALGSATSRLSDAARAFEDLTKQDAKDAAAWYNLGLTRAWLGENAAAIGAFDHYIELETNEADAAEAGTLVEILRLGQGMEEQCDYREFGVSCEIRNVEAVQALLDDWANNRRLIQIPMQDERIFASMLLEIGTTGLVTVGRPAAEVGRYAGIVMIVGNRLRYTCAVKERFDRVKDEIRDKLGLGLGELRDQYRPCPFAEVVSESLVAPLTPTEGESQQQKIFENVNRFYEDTWIHRPLKSLTNIPPVDAAGHPKLRKKLLGVIRFLEECAAFGALKGYSFDSLRRKLGLHEPATTSTATITAPTSSGVGDITGMSAFELTTLPIESLSDTELESAYQTAYRLDALDIAAHFAKSLLSRPPQPGKTDRFPWFSFLIKKAILDGENDVALDHVNEGQKYDCEHNEGKRRNDYELSRGQVHSKRREVHEAEDVFQRLIGRAPTDFAVRGKAAEAMLALKEHARALRFAEEGVEAARKANDRGSEEYLLGLVAAAKKGR